MAITLKEKALNAHLTKIQVAEYALEKELKAIQADIEKLNHRIEDAPVTAAIANCNKFSKRYNFTLASRRDSDDTCITLAIAAVKSLNALTADQYRTIRFGRSTLNLIQRLLAESK